ncbi:hypothetical protein OIU84_006183 [Salix udensis]|uniref:AMP-binding enzyme C-terminal domain-containing protein n=1 Tax=Salix udensis TaxID=889485 RepID=A0AAD6P243_9ROSI|nr:hypothetical protein OIU84_006183 [Salix udensis]
MKGGWFHTGDLGVRHPSGFVQMKDRAKDIIISGGEAVSTLEVEAVLLSHPEVSEAAVVGQPDAVLNEVPCAFVRLKEGFSASAEDIIEFCGDQLPDHMIPKKHSVWGIASQFLRKGAEIFYEGDGDQGVLGYGDVFLLPPLTVILNRPPPGIRPLMLDYSKLGMSLQELDQGDENVIVYTQHAKLV